MEHQVTVLCRLNEVTADFCALQGNSILLVKHLCQFTDLPFFCKNPPYCFQSFFLYAGCIENFNILSELFRQDGLGAFTDGLNLSNERQPALPIGSTGFPVNSGLLHPFINSSNGTNMILQFPHFIDWRLCQRNYAKAAGNFYRR